MNLADCRAVITGASGGIGGALVAELGAAGVRMIVCGRRKQRLETLAARWPGQISTVAGDLSTKAVREQLLDAAKAANVNLLINAAGTSGFGNFLDFDAAGLEAHLQANLLLPMVVAHTLLPLLTTRRQALIVNVGSAFDRIGFPGFTAYSAAKFGLRGFSEALRRELAGTGVGVLHFAPRATKTDFNDDRVEAMNSALATKVDTPEAVARGILHAIANSKRDVQFGWPEKLFVRLNQWFPALIDADLRRKLPTIEAAAATHPPMERPS